MGLGGRRQVSIFLLFNIERFKFKLFSYWSMGDLVLDDTTLATLVSDDEINPAGGIVKFGDLYFPSFPRVVLVHTGSHDKTLRKLEELAARHPHITIINRAFDGFANSRNFILDQVNTRWAMILDTDERIKSEDIGLMQYVMESDLRTSAYNFPFVDIFPDGFQIGHNHNPRLFQMDKKPRYQQELVEDRTMEYLVVDGVPMELLARTLPIPIYHFRPRREALTLKEKAYQQIAEHSAGLRSGHLPAIHSVPTWKAYDPRSEGYYERLISKPGI